MTTNPSVMLKLFRFLTSPEASGISRLPQETPYLKVFFWFLLYNFISEKSILSSFPQEKSRKYSTFRLVISYKN